MAKRKTLPRLGIEYGINQSPPTSNRPNGSFIVSIWFNKQQVHIGSFANLEVARIARNAKMRELGIKAKPMVAGAEHLPDDLKLPATTVKIATVPRAVKTGYPIESLSQKFDRQQKAKKEAAAIDAMRSDEVAKNYHPSLYRDDGKDYTPFYRHRSMSV
jgi:hypothetical protein